MLKHLMEQGQAVAGGDRLGKTILFAKNHGHAEFIVQRFDENYPQSLIDGFSQPEKAPHVAVSADILDTGINVPEIVNLVFFKLVRSKTKFWQMVKKELV